MLFLFVKERDKAYVEWAHFGDTFFLFTAIIAFSLLNIRLGGLSNRSVPVVLYCTYVGPRAGNVQPH